MRAVLPAIVIGSLTAGTALATTRVAAFDALDMDRNGRISAAEAAADALVNERFNELDRNADGSIDQTEYASLQASRRS